MKKKHSDAFENNSIKVPFVVPNIENSDKNAIEIGLKSNLLTDGPILRKFEKEFCKITGSKYSIGVGSGTDALFLSLKAIGIDRGDEVITVPNTAVPTVTAIVNAGASVKFVDINKYSLIDVSKISNAINDKTKAIIPSW